MSDKPYRVYRGGNRARTDDPELALPGDDTGAAGERRGPVVLPPPGAPPPAAASPGPARPRGRRRWGRIVGVVVGLLVVLFVAFLALGYRAFSASVQRANHRLDRLAGTSPVAAVLNHQGGMVVSHATTILVLGRDRTGRSDSIQLIRADPGRHLVSTLAIPRDLRVAIAGHGLDKINAAFSYGGPALAIKTVRAFVGVPIDHVVVVDFSGIVRLVDAVGGVDIVSPKRLRSTFDGKTVAFPAGPIHLDGHAALAYARVRKNELDASDSDVTRGQRQQQVMQALRIKLGSVSTLVNLRDVGARSADPLATDLSAWDIMQLGWVDFRSDRHLLCHLGGAPTLIAGVAYLQSSDQNRRVINEFLGTAAALPVSATDPFAPGCT